MNKILVWVFCEGDVELGQERGNIKAKIQRKSVYL